MRIGVLGTGRVGGVLGTRWAARGHQVVFGSRDPQSTKAQQLREKAGGSVTVSTLAEAAAGAEVLLLATPYDAAPTLLPSLGELGSRVLIDCSNPLKPDLSGLVVGGDTSAAEQIAGWARGGRVVKAFNVASAATMAQPVYHGQPASLFYCGDDREAKAAVRQLVTDLDFEPVDAGPLRMARYLESFAMLYIHLAVREGWGSHCAFKMLRREPAR
ncbi:MAG: NADPH-dependent F420 reductase [Pirellulales bacterium]